MKTDQQLKQDVSDELAWDPAVKSERVGVAVKNGIVTLSGHIETYAEKRAVEKALRRVNGVKAIALELDVMLSPDHQRGDTDIAQAADLALRWNSSLPPQRVCATVEHGWVTLSGEVDWDAERMSAEKAVRSLIGVIGVRNEITLRPRATPAGIGTRIEKALERHAEREARRITVDVRGATVTLRGSIDSWRERDAAAGAAWSAPGVLAVVNELRVE
jgi:osmotically-inducible protein OsmY